MSVSGAAAGRRELKSGLHSPSISLPTTKFQIARDTIKIPPGCNFLWVITKFRTFILILSLKVWVLWRILPHNSMVCVYKFSFEIYNKWEEGRSTFDIQGQFGPLHPQRNNLVVLLLQFLLSLLTSNAIRWTSSAFTSRVRSSCVKKHLCYI